MKIRLIALFLSVTVMFECLAMPAYAIEDEAENTGYHEDIIVESDNDGTEPDNDSEIEDVVFDETSDISEPTPDSVWDDYTDEDSIPADATADETWYTEWAYNTKGNSIELVKYNGTGTEVTIPAKTVISGTEYNTVLRGSNTPSSLYRTFPENTRKIHIEKGVKAYKDIIALFYGCTEIEELDLSGLDMSDVERMGYMFYGCSKLKEIASPDWSKCRPTIMYGMFSECNSLESIDLLGIDTSQINSLSNLFYNCYALKTVNLSSFDTSNVTDMKEMFEGCRSLESIDLSSFDTSNVTNMEGMFEECHSLESIDLSSFNTGKVTSFGGMFSQCYELSSIDVTGFDTSNCINIRRMFQECHKLVKIDLSSFNTSKCTSMGNLFSSCENLEEIDVSNFDTSKVQDMASMFSGCEKIERLDLKGFDTSNVKEIHSMFSGCKKLRDLDISSFNTTNVDTWGGIAGMFYNCESLENIDISSFNTANVKSMKELFAGCNALKSIDVSNLDTTNVEEMDAMFASCQSLTYIDISNFNTPKLSNVTRMFANCEKLQSIKFGSFDTHNVETFGSMFERTPSLIELDLSGFSMDKARFLDGMFYECTSLKKIYVAPGADWSSYGNKNDNLFYKCENLSGDISYSKGKDGIEYAKIHGGYFTDVTGYQPPYQYSIGFVSNYPKNAIISENDRIMRDVSGIASNIDYSIPLCTYDCEKYSFVEWNTIADGSGTSYRPGDIVKALGKKEGEYVRLYAIWKLTPVSSIVLSNSNWLSEPGEETVITASISPSDAHDQSFTWDNSNPGVIMMTIDEEDPTKITIKAVKFGKAVITATANDGSGVIGKCYVLVESNDANDYSEVLASDIPASGNIPDGIWIAGITDLSYTGTALNQNFRVYDGTVMLTPKTDYTVKYKNNKKAYSIADPNSLTADDKKKAPQILITMKGNYSGKETVYFSINPTGENPEVPKTDIYSIAGDKITITDEFGNADISAEYNKAGAKASITIMYEDKILKEGRDYTLKFSGNTKYPATKASVTVTGKGNFNNKKTIPIKVIQRPFSEESGITVVANDKVEGKKAGQYSTTVKVFDSEGKLLKAGTDYEKNIIYLKNSVELTKTDFPKAGEVITVRVTGKGGYTNDSIETTYNITAAGQVNDIGKATFKIKNQQYNKGTPITIEAQDVFDQAFIGKNKTPLKLSTDDGATGDFMVVPGSYVKNTAKGTAKVTFMGINGQTGTKTVSFKIDSRSIADIWAGAVRGSNDNDQKIYTFKGISFVIPEEFKYDKVRTFDSGAVRMDGTKEGVKWSLLVTNYDPDNTNRKWYKYFDRMDTIYGEAELRNHGYALIVSDSEKEFRYVEAALIRMGDDLVKIEAEHVADDEKVYRTEENKAEYVGVMADLLPKMLVSNSKVTPPVVSNYQFKHENFKYNIPDTYDVMYTFSDEIDRARANEFLLKHGDLDVHLYLANTDNIYSIYDQKMISTGDFSKSATTIKTDKYGTLELYNYESTYENLHEQFELVPIEAGKTYMIATYRADSNMNILSDLIPQMIKDTGTRGSVEVMNAKDARIAVDDKYSIKIGMSYVGFGMNIPTGWKISDGSNQSGVGYYGLFLENAGGLDIYAASDEEGIGFPINRYFYLGDQTSKEKIVSIEYKETVQCKYGEVQIYRIVSEVYDKDFSSIRTKDKEIGLLCNNDEKVCFVASSKVKECIEKINSAG